MTRKMASVALIEEICPIKGADRIEHYRVKGWWVVDGVGKYKIGDRVIFCEIDSFIPVEIAPFLVKNNKPKEYERKFGSVLKTVKLKGALSQGLLLPLPPALSQVDVGEDVSKFLGILKYEPPIPAVLAGDAVGLFPSFIPKTDEERVQNFPVEEFAGKFMMATEKLEGSSMTTYFNEGHFGVCSRNLELKDTPNNTLWLLAKQLELPEKLAKLGFNLAISGELIGPGVQKNIYGLNKHEFRPFTMFNIDERRRLNVFEFRSLCLELKLNPAPLILQIFVPNSVEQILKMAEGKSALNEMVEREGLVFRSTDQSFSFKAISNKYLLQ